MPNTSTSTAVHVWSWGRRCCSSTRIIRVVNSEEDRSVCSTGQPRHSARAEQVPGGLLRVGEHAAGDRYAKNISRVSFWPSRSSFRR